METSENLITPTRMQRLEGLLLLGAAIWIFAQGGETWWLFALLLLAPDVSMLGYIDDPVMGAAVYNVGHILLGPAVLLAWGVGSASGLLLALGAVWLAHIGLDRLAGYGLKYADGFHHTHLGMIGPVKRAGTA